MWENWNIESIWDVLFYKHIKNYILQWNLKMYWQERESRYSADYLVINL